MKKRTDKILLAIFLLSLVFYVFLLPRYLEIISFSGPAWMFPILSRLSLTFHAVPAFCLQLLMCRKTRRRVAAAPAIIIIGAALWFAYGFFTATGWDTLGWGILLFLTAAPAVGCALAWAAYGLHRAYKRGGIRG